MNETLNLTQRQLVEIKQSVVQLVFQKLQEKLGERKKFRKGTLNNALNAVLIKGRREDRNTALITKGELSVLDLIKTDSEALKKQILNELEDAFED